MYGIIYLKMGFYPFIGVFYLLLILSTSLLSCIIGFVIYKRKNDRNKKLWLESISTVISQAIFFEDKNGEWEDIIYKIDMLIQNRRYRNNLIDELIQANKNLSGASTLNLKKLYDLLELDKDSLSKLNSRKSHIQAKGIQEMAMMGQIKHVKQIFRLTNNKNELVRSEAQSALVSFYGFPGLRFLNVTAYPISEWQQIQLLNKLKDSTAISFEPLKKWLQSQIESVKVFSLKLATCYSCHEMYSSVIDCLQSTNLKVKVNALQYLKKMPQQDTAKQIISSYSTADKTYKLAVIEALGSMGNEMAKYFIVKKLHDTDDEIKMAAAKALLNLHASGTAVSPKHLFTKGIFLNNNILQLKKGIAV